jgi:hypothetical protein
MNRCPILKKYRVMTVWNLKYNWTYMQQNTSKQFMINIMSKSNSWNKLLSINSELRLKLVFDNLTISCKAAVRLVVNRVSESAGIGMEFVQDQLRITLYTNFKVNLITNT